jgi:hypothetical protein
METGLMLVLAEIIIICMISQLVIYIDLRYHRSMADDSLEVDVFLFNKFLLYSMNVPLIKLINEEGLPWVETKIRTKDGIDKAHLQREQRFMGNVLYLCLFHPKRMWRILRSFHYYLQLYQRFMFKLLKAVTCETFYWKTTYGSEDAAVTGYTAGMLWAVKKTALARMKRRLSFSSEPVVQVKPVFGKSCLEVDFRCIFSLRLGKVINASTVLFKLKCKGATRSE